MEQLAMLPAYLFSLVFLFLLMLSDYLCLGIDDLLINQIKQHQVTSSCNSTIQGRHLRADNRGYVCKIMEVDALTGCCPESQEQYSCWGCNVDSECCDSYEYCVACCLNPMLTPYQVALRTKVALQVTAGTSTSVFDYCQGRCRHNSGSVVHENAYASEHHHCFSHEGSSGDPGPAKDVPVLDDAMIATGRQGQSCDEACQEVGKICNSKAIPELNNCTKLKKYLNCKVACISSNRPDLPAEVVTTAPRHLYPGACMFTTNQFNLSCQGSHPYSRRLCPCK